MRTNERFSQPRQRPQPGRPERPAYGDRPSFGAGPGGGDRPPFTPRPPFAGPGPSRPVPPPAATPAEAASTVCLRQGDREVTVTGSRIFIRQTLDELPSLFAKLTGTPVPTPASISIPANPARTPPTEVEAPTVVALPAYEPQTRGPRAERHPAPNRDTGATRNPAAEFTKDPGSLEDSVFAVLQRSKRPLKVVELRAQLDGNVTGQQVRRILERSDRVVSNGDKPTAYRLR